MSLQVQLCKRTQDINGSFVVVPGGWRYATTEDLAELHSLNFSQINVYLPQVPGALPGEASPEPPPQPPKKAQH